VKNSTQNSRSADTTSSRIFIKMGPHFVIRIYKETTGELIREDHLPTMQFEPRWGGCSRLQILEEKTEQVLKELA